VTAGVQYLSDVANGASLLTIPTGHALYAMCCVLGEFEALSATLANHRPEVALMDGEGREVGRWKRRRMIGWW
jgi:hypothetical protein